MEKLVKNLARLAAPLISAALLAIVALTLGGCSGESIQTADADSPDLKKSLHRKYAELANPLVAKVKQRSRRLGGRDAVRSRGSWWDAGRRCPGRTTPLGRNS